ncbi:MAG: chloride channel protein [Candidatus Margulisbacteria bacterium]|nr:chloride channel protein [Candidatus Margulisiibacteriota bacterium]
MKKRITEETVLFFSIIKWVFFATIIGGIVGLSTTFFLYILSWGISTTHRYPLYFILLPLALFCSAILIKYLAPDAEGHGTERVIEAIHKNFGKIKAIVVPVKLVATVITLAFGGSAGKEGPSAQIGAGLSSVFADLFKFSDEDRKKLVICGISAGFAAVFGTPIAGSIFGVEVLFVGGILYEVLLPSFIAGITSYQISSRLGIVYFYHPTNILSGFTELFFIKIILAGIFFGICSFIFIEILKYGKKISQKMKIWSPLKGLFGGALLVCLSFIFTTKYLGLGLESIETFLNGNFADWGAFILKPVFTSITLNFEGSGGVITPIFFSGAAAGTLFARVLHLNVANFAAIGMVSMLAGCANTPIAASIMAVELFGPKIAPYATVACIISFLMTGHRSVYPSQILSVTKSQSIQVDIGNEIKNIKPVCISAGEDFNSRLRQVFISIRNLFRL